VDKRGNTEADAIIASPIAIEAKRPRSSETSNAGPGEEMTAFHSHNHTERSISYPDGLLAVKHPLDPKTSLLTIKAPILTRRCP
jgi:hypothetical protein